MKLTILFITLCFLQVSAASYAQKINLSGQDISLVKALESIHKQSGYALFYNNTLVKQAGNTSINLKDASLEDAMNEVLKDKPFTYTIIDKTIVIKEKEPTILDKLKKAFTPPTDIIGRVTNEQGEPLNGATITTKRTQTSTLSDANGNFTVKNISPTDTLIVSYLGYKRAFIGLGNQTSLKVVLQVATNKLDEVVVQAYGETSQRLTTGSIGRVTAADIEKQPVMNPLQALQGRVAGLIVTQTSGYASAPFKVEIRGRNAIGDFPSDPLYVIDGVPLTVLDIGSTASYNNGSPGLVQNDFNGPANGQSPFFSLNPADIESIEVLKDADATSIYGSRAANGVILITTKKGKAGKTHLNSNIYQGTSYVTRQWDMLNTSQYVAMREEALRNDGLPVDIINAPDIVSWGITNNTNWQNFLWGRVGHTTDAQSSLSGGDELTNFRIGGGYHRETSILSSGVDQRGSVSINLNHKGLNQKFTLAFTANYSYAQSDNISLSPSEALLPPNAPPVYDSKGNLNYAGWAPLQYLYPYASLLQPYSSKTYFLNSSLSLGYQIFKGLKFKTTLGYNNGSANQTDVQPIASQDPESNATGSAEFGNNINHNVIAEPQLEYNTFLSKGRLAVLIGGSGQTTVTQGSIVKGSGYTNDALINSISFAPTVRSSDKYGELKYASLFARINYNLKDEYIINLNIRRDGSSKFGPGRQYGNFGSVGGAWIFSENQLVKNTLPFLSFGKLRGSYGTTGSDNIGLYGYLTSWSSSGLANYNGTFPVIPLKHTDSLYQWQVNRKTEVAIDFGILKDRITFEIAWYRDVCGNQLVQLPTPVFTGFGSVLENSVAKVENSGMEYLVNAKVIDNKDFKWSMSFNCGNNHNKLLSYPNLSQSPYANTFVVGQSLNIIKTYHYIGVDPQTGLYTFADKNQDGQISIDYTGKNADDRYVQNISPKLTGGFSNTFHYKDFDLTAFFYFKKQLGINAFASGTYPGTLGFNQPVQVINRWQAPGNQPSYARYTTGAGTSNTITDGYFYASDGVWSDASFIRLANLSLSYSIPSIFTKRLGVASARFYLQCQNLFVITGYKGLDPETQSFGSLPPQKVVTGGLELNF